MVDTIETIQEQYSLASQIENIHKAHNSDADEHHRCLMHVLAQHPSSIIMNPFEIETRNVIPLAQYRGP